MILLWHTIQINLAYIIDLLIGDPIRIPHPVVYIGKAIRKVEGFLRKFVKTNHSAKIAGIFLVIIIVGGSSLLVYLLLYVLALIHPILSFVVGTWIISTTIATKGLAKEGKKLKKLLIDGNISEARVQVNYLVARDTEDLDEEGVSRATIETVAENIVDAFVSPLFYAMLGGPVFAILYRATNTLDSMCGYKNEKYLYFGWASARFDDVLNYIPARITGVLITLAALIARFDWKSSLRIWKRDSHKHPSPNSGIPEGTVAGALGIQLGGLNSYFGEKKQRAFMGDKIEVLCATHIEKTILLLYLSATLFVIIFNLLIILTFLIR